MKLRRAMAAAAATAAIAPLALLSAPAAFAEESPSTAVSSPAAEENTPTGEASTPTTETSTPAGEDSTPATGGESTPADSVSPAAGESASSEPSDEPSSTPGDTSEPSAEPSDCPVDDDGVDADSQLGLDVSGLPGRIVAGSGWHNFTLTAANHSDEALGTVQWLALVDNDSTSDNEKNWLSTYARLEYLNPETKVWESLADEVGNGIYFGETALGAKQTVAIQLRVDITAKAPAGDGFTLGLGGYVDEKKNCVHSAFGYYEFTVLKPGSSNEDPGRAEETDKGDKPAGGKSPQGGADEIPATGSLAETGSSSMLPTIGIVGGVAVVAGAGALFVVRRRKSGDATA